jgi:hypothetical protein
LQSWASHRDRAKTAFASGKYQLFALVAAAAVGLWQGMKPFVPIPLPRGGQVRFVHAMAEMNQPLWLGLIGLVILIALVRRRFQSWRSVVGLWMLAGIVGSLIHHYYLSK